MSLENLNLSSSSLSSYLKNKELVTRVNDIVNSHFEEETNEVKEEEVVEEVVEEEKENNYFFH